LAASDDAVIRRLGSVGQPVPSIEVQIRGEDGGVVGPGQTGELFVRGEQVSGRYTDIGSVLDADGWFPTKDAAWMDDEGYLFIDGRTDDVIIRGGENIAPAEIEDVLLRHPDVAEAAVIGQSDEDTGQAICAFVTVRGGIEESEELVGGIREGVAERIGKFARPKRIIWAADLPKTRSGKIMRRLLRDIAEGRALGDVTTLKEPEVMQELEAKIAEEQAKEN
jgi:acyl-coenzyme A synthetase/AMP-(fatty) acid ligase